MAAIAHLAPGLADDVDEFFSGVVGVRGGEIVDLVFEEHQAGGVFEGLGAGVAHEVRF